MARNGGVGALLAVLGLVYFMNRGGSSFVSTVQVPGYGGSPASPYPDPETPEEAEELQTQMIRTRKIIIHRTVRDPPVIPSISQIRTSRERIAVIDEGIPKWVKDRWSDSRMAVARQGELPLGEV